MSDPTPVRCPAIADPEAGPADPADFAPLLARLATAGEVAASEAFPRGTVQPDGRLDLCKQGLGPAQTARIVAAAVDSPLVRHLLLGTNGLGADGARAVAGALRPGHHVETLYLGCNRIDADGVAALATRLVRLQRLYLGGNGFGPEAVPALGTLIHAAGVHEIYLAANHLGDAGAGELARLAEGVPLTLGLGGNGLSPAGAAVLARHLGAWTALDLSRPPSERSLGARGNVVGDEGAYALADALGGARLRRLDLRRTAIGGRGARRLVAAVQGHPTMAYLGLNGGVPRRQRREATRLLAAQPAPVPHPDVRAIASVYR